MRSLDPNTVYSTPQNGTLVVVVSPFVGQDGPIVDRLKSLSDVTFLQNQAITRGTSLASGPTQAVGVAMVAYGSQPRNTTRSHIQRNRHGKRFVKYEAHGRRYAKPLGRNESPVTRRYGYNTRMNTKAGVKGKSRQMSRSRVTRNVGVGVIGFGKALPYIGVGLAVANVIHNPEQASQDSADYGFFGLPIMPGKGGDGPMPGLATHMANLPGAIGAVSQNKRVQQGLLVRAIIEGM